MNYCEWFEKAKKSIEPLNYGDTFTLAKLLYSSGWETLSRGEKSNFGKYFKNEVVNNHIPCIVLIYANGAKQYRKIKNF
ncbi:MAG: single-stranded DNA-binding protein [Ruminococcus sp.]|nr:single-stranded DNA-binding protein [Ruminococcus sp.]MDE6848717.1 single-stranded DNA-binding protein [Ruminococcus sp.]MDE7137138.1 single-stranded DNA-binding protein [Ruminococcus sp.]